MQEKGSVVVISLHLLVEERSRILVVIIGKKGLKYRVVAPGGGGVGELEEYTITMFTYRDCKEEVQAR